MKFSNIGSSTVAEIQRIELARKNRGAFINFFRDWFSSEKQELEALKNRQKVAQALQDSYTRLASGVEWVKFRNVMKALGDKLLQTPASLSSAEVDELRNAVGSLLNHRSYKAEAKSFVVRLQSKIVAQVGALAKSAEPSLLTNQFAFLAENKIVGAAALNEARVAVINAIKQQAVAFEDPQTALRFIENLKTAKYECLDAGGALSRYLDEITKDYQAWKALQENGPALLAGALDVHAVKEMRDHAIRAFKSALPRVKEAAKVFDESLRKVVLENVTNLQVADELKTGTLISILEKHLQFYTLDERYAEEPCFNASKAAIRGHVNKTLEEYTDASEAQAYIGKWDKLNQEILKAFDIALYQDIQNKRNQYKSLDLI
ncbi:hypothetical protein AQUSIP_06210 [Aquicella siphonis]|uniref:Uncharacterized protein n=1 Tax=Aquicella siphonis TaxID=254247 RepID=A0A5E4PFP3_9COXI|nr:hypothetical protein [Aquicella siphonis]VVC75332.1 hypothetical protein AQUSIP_06210 [Aquicella siphonis]